jgi:putative PIN family toxin of toxin-antitoxin system
MRVVLDTNILVSALLWRGAPYRCLLAVQAGLADLVISPPILEELRTVLVTKFRHTARDADEAIGLIQTAADVVEISGQLRVVPDDPDDDKFVETAQAGRAERIVSGDRHLLALGSAAGVPVITAREFLDQLGGAGA